MEGSICCLLDGLKKCKETGTGGQLLRFVADGSDHVILFLGNINDDIFPTPMLAFTSTTSCIGLTAMQTNRQLALYENRRSSLLPYFSINASVNPPGFPGGQKCPPTNVHPALCISFHSFMTFNRTSSPAALASSAES